MGPQVAGGRLDAQAEERRRASARIMFATANTAITITGGRTLGST